MKLLRMVGKLFDRIMVVAFALAFVQIPVTMDRYEEVLEKAQERSKPVYEDVRFRSLNENFALPDDYLTHIAQQSSNKDSVELIRATVHRYENYHDELETLRSHNFWERPWYMFKVYRSNIWQSVEYVPGISWTWEGLAYAGLGILVASLFIWILLRIFFPKET